MASGGKRKGSGRKPGSVKPEAEKRLVRKLYQWTPVEYERITQAVQKAATIESKFIQGAVMEKVANVMWLDIKEIEPEFFKPLHQDFREGMQITLRPSEDEDAYATKIREANKRMK